MIKKSAIWVIILILMVIIGITQKNITQLKGKSWTLESMTYLPNDGRIADFLLGYRTTVAHYLWIQTMIYFGTHATTDKSYKWLTSMIDIITKLNPYFFPAYEFAGVLLPDITGNPNISKIILERGLTHCKSPNQYKIAVHLGMLHYTYYGDVLTAASYINLASRAPDAPVNKLAGLVAVLYQKGGLAEYGFEYLVYMYETTENPEVKRHIIEKIKIHYPDRLVAGQRK
jgi:hypothetical protein